MEWCNWTERKQGLWRPRSNNRDTSIEGRLVFPLNNEWPDQKSGFSTDPFFHHFSFDKIRFYVNFSGCTSQVIPFSLSLSDPLMLLFIYFILFSLYLYVYSCVCVQCITKITHVENYKFISCVCNFLWNQSFSTRPSSKNISPCMCTVFPFDDYKFQLTNAP